MPHFFAMNDIPAPPVALIQKYQAHMCKFSNLKYIC